MSDDFSSKDAALIARERQKLERTQEAVNAMKQTLDKSISEVLKSNPQFRQQLRSELLNSRGNRGGAAHSFKGTGEAGVGYGCVEGDELITGYEDKFWERD